MATTTTHEVRTPRAFRKELPHQLTPTNLEGAYTTPAPPDEFDPNSATATNLLRHGIFLKRPSVGDAPEVTAAWERVFSRKWRPQDRITPHLVPQLGVTHNKRKVRKTDAGFSSNNWGGGSIQGRWVTAIGTWVVPTVSKPSEAQGAEGGWNSSSWVGIDGAYGSNDVLQAGVQHQVDANGNASYVAWFEWFAPISKVTLGDTSPLTPALASLNGNMYIGWKGDGNDNLNVMVSTDNGQSFHNKFISGETSPKAPALAAHNGNLYIAWKGDGNDNLNVAIVDLDPAGSPVGFSNKVILGDTSPLSPSLASVNGNLYLSWRGDGNDQLNVMVSLDNGRTFGNKFISGETSTEPPVLGTFNGSLMIAWKGDGNDNLNVARVNTNPSPTGFSNKVTLGDTSPRSPALGELNGRLYIAWKGDGNDQLNVMFSTDGQNFGNKSIGVETSPEAPSLVNHNGDLFIGWKGDGNDNLNVATVTELPAPAYVFQTNITNFPVRPGDTVNCSVQYINGVAGQLNFGNQTTGQHTTITLVPPPGATFDGDSVEWIMEAPDGGEPISSLPKFTPVAFTGALGCGADGRTVGNPQNADTWTVINGSVFPAETLTSTALASAANRATNSGGDSVSGCPQPLPPSPRPASPTLTHRIDNRLNQAEPWTWEPTRARTVRCPPPASPPFSCVPPPSTTSTTSSIPGWPETSIAHPVSAPPVSGHLSTPPSPASPTCVSSTPSPALLTWSSPPTPASSATASSPSAASITPSDRARNPTSAAGSSSPDSKSATSPAPLPLKAKATPSSTPMDPASGPVTAPAPARTATAS